MISKRIIEHSINISYNYYFKIINALAKSLRRADLHYFIKLESFSARAWAVNIRLVTTKVYKLHIDI